MEKQLRLLFYSSSTGGDGRMIRLAEAQDIDHIMRVVEKTILVMRDEDNPQWDDEYPAAAHFLDDVARRTLYVFEADGEIAGFICIDDFEPAEYERVAWHSSGKALVIHRMAVSPDFRGRGVATSLLEFADRLAIDSGVAYLKTDTYGKNAKMNALFSRNGFVRVGKMSFRGMQDAFTSYDKIVAADSSSSAQGVLALNV
jgi:GNAT superfamily N-acetyltransferase